MGNVLEQPPFGREQSCDALCHTIESAAQFAEFVPAFRVHARGQIARAKPIHGSRERAQWRADADGQKPAEERHCAKDQCVIG